MVTELYYSDHGYAMGGEWPQVVFVRLYKNTKKFPHQLDKLKKKCQPVAQFAVGVFRGGYYSNESRHQQYAGLFENGTKCYFGISCKYSYSEN